MISWNIVTLSQELEEYRKLLESVWKDSVVTDQEFTFLPGIRKQEGVSRKEHHRIW